MGDLSGQNESNSNQLLSFVFGHGLCRDKQECSGIRALKSAFESLEASKSSCGLSKVTFYDARGHGEASGWQRGCPAQFHWRSLAVDMLLVARADQKDSGRGFL